MGDCTPQGVGATIGFSETACNEGSIHMDLPLIGRTIAIPETRELKLLAELLEEKGASTVRCPLVAIYDAPDPEPIVRWLRSLIAGDLHDLVLMTGEGLRRLIGFAEREGLRENVVAALGRVRKVTRGPKPAKALREIGLAPDLPSDRPTTEGVITTLSRENLAGRLVGVQLVAAKPNPPLTEFLERAGATVRTVAPYVYAPQSEEEKVAELIGCLQRETIDVIAFTSTPQVERLWEVARKHGILPALEQGLARTRVAAVGPVVADEIRMRGVRLDIMPESSYFMRPLVNEIIRALARPLV